MGGRCQSVAPRRNRHGSYGSKASFDTSIRAAKSEVPPPVARGELPEVPRQRTSTDFHGISLAQDTDFNASTSAATSAAEIQINTSSIKFCQLPVEYYEVNAKDTAMTDGVISSPK